MLIPSQGVYLYNVEVGTDLIFPVALKSVFLAVGNDINDVNYSTSTQVLTFGNYRNNAVKIGSVTIDQRITSFFGRVMIVGKS